MSRTLTGLAAALFVSVLVPACGRRVCLLGPLFVDSRTVIAAAGVPFDQTFPADTNLDGSGTPMPFVSATDLPSGLAVTVEGADLHLAGTLPEAGTHDFVVTLHEEEHNSCAPWARYDFTLEVQ